MSNDITQLIGGLLPSKVRAIPLSELFSAENFYPYDIYKVCDKHDTAQYYALVAALAGISKDEVSIDLSGDLLTVEVNPKEIKYEVPKDCTLTFLRRSISYKKARLELKLIGVDKTAIEAKFIDGALVVILPIEVRKAESTKIDIK